MKKLTLISGLPRAGTTLLCQILNSNPINHVTPTSGTIDLLSSLRSTFSHNPSFKAQERLKIYESIRMSMRGAIEGFFFDKDVVFDKCRGWSSKIKLLDEVLGNTNTKIIWCYRDPIAIIGSIESQYQKTILLENADEINSPGAFNTLDDRIGTFANEGSIIQYPIKILKDAIEMGYGDRILIVKYHELTTNTQQVMNAIHNFIDEPEFQYDLKNIKQSTFEWDGVYNYKFLHTIKEGEIKWSAPKFEFQDKFKAAINDKFMAINKLVLEGNSEALLSIQEPAERLPRQVQIIQ